MTCQVRRPRAADRRRQPNTPKDRPIEARRADRPTGPARATSLRWEDRRRADSDRAAERSWRLATVAMLFSALAAVGTLMVV